MNPKTGRWTRGGDEIVVAVKRAFTTPKASRVMRRFLGMERAQLLDRPIEPGMLGPTTVALANSLRYEPRVRLRRLTLDRASVAGSAEIAIEIERADGRGVMRVAT